MPSFRGEFFRATVRELMTFSRGLERATWRLPRGVKAGAVCGLADQGLTEGAVQGTANERIAVA